MSSESAWTIDTFCASQAPVDVTALHSSSQDFLQLLNLPFVHPFCLPEAPRPFEWDGVPPQGPLLSNDHLETLGDVVVTVAARTLPAFLAMAELWLRLLASLVAPLGVARLLYDAVVTIGASGKRSDISSSRKLASRKDMWCDAALCWVTIASSIVLCTDTLYVLEYGPYYGFSLWVASTVLVLQKARTKQHHHLTRNLVLLGKIALALWGLHLLYDYESNQWWTFGQASEQCRIDEGLYYDVSHPWARTIVHHWPESHRTYSPEGTGNHNHDAPHDAIGATPWMPTGDSRTGLPFLLLSVPSPTWHRVWLPLDDGETAALDVAFPTTTGHNHSQPIYLLLHGLNGGSQEEYVKDFALRRNSEGSTVIVFIARGLMDLPMRGWDLFHGARVTDVHQAAQAVRLALAPQQALAGVGYSMGGIVLANYLARSGENCALDAAVSVSGGLDMRYEEVFYRAQRLWQPILTQELRDTFVVGKWGERVRKRLTKEEMKEMLRAYHITAIDRTAIVAYNKFRDLNHYYSEMSALGDIPVEDHAAIVNGTKLISEVARDKRVHNISIPLCVIHALDDPLITWRTVAANDGLLHPSNLTQFSSGNLFLLLTKRGGHVGWPLGWNPATYKWKWMNDAASSFIDAALKARPSS